MRLPSSCTTSGRTLLLAGSFLSLLATSIATPPYARQETTTSSSSSVSSAAASSPSSSSPSVTSSSTSTTSGTTSSTDSVLTTSATSSAAPSDSTSATGSIDPDLVTTSISSAASTATLSPTAAPAGGFPKCIKEDVGVVPPFCLPLNGSTKYVGDSYYVTWDTSEYSNNYTIVVELNFANANASTPDAQSAWSSPPTPENYGYTIVTMDSAWLQGKSANNLSFFVVALDKDQEVDASPPLTITLTNAPAQHLPAQVNSNINRLGLEVGIPLGLAFFFVVLIGLWVGMRKHRRIDVGNLMRRKRGYGVGRSRRQRMGKNAAIGLDDLPAERDPGAFRDLPSPEFDRYEQEHGNAFRDEIERQQTGR